MNNNIIRPKHPIMLSHVLASILGWMKTISRGATSLSWKSLCTLNHPCAAGGKGGAFALLPPAIPAATSPPAEVTLPTPGKVFMPVPAPRGTAPE